MKFKKGDWVRSARVRSKGPFNAEVVEIWQGEYILRDADRNRWLRKESEVFAASEEEGGSMTCGSSYARYHALDWAATKSKAEIEAEIEAVERKANTHEFKWNEVGNRSDTWTRADVLRELLKEKI
jgi:hypothetical protein